jgi:hypothetical protein
MLIDDITALICGFRDYKRYQFDSGHLDHTAMFVQADKTIESIFGLIKQNKKQRQKFYKHKRHFRRYPDRQNTAPKQEANGLSQTVQGGNNQRPYRLVGDKDLRL